MLIQNGYIMKYRLIHPLFALLFALYIPCIAQQPSQSVKGSVLDKDTRQPLVGATVIVATAEGKPGTVTGYDGRFELPGVPVGRHRIDFQYLGYEPYIVEDAILNSAKELVLYF